MLAEDELGDLRNVIINRCYIVELAEEQAIEIERKLDT